MATTTEIDWRKELAQNDVEFTSPATGKTYKVIRLKEIQEYGIVVDGKRAGRRRGMTMSWFTRSNAVMRCEEIDRDAQAALTPPNKDTY